MTPATANIFVELRFRRGALPALVAANAVWHVLLRQPMWVPPWAFRTRLVYRPSNSNG